MAGHFCHLPEMFVLFYSTNCFSFVFRPGHCSALHPGEHQRSNNRSYLRRRCSMRRRGNISDEELRASERLLGGVGTDVQNLAKILDCCIVDIMISSGHVSMTRVDLVLRLNRKFKTMFGLTFATRNCYRDISVILLWSLLFCCHANLSPVCVSEFCMSIGAIYISVLFRVWNNSWNVTFRCTHRTPVLTCSLDIRHIRSPQLNGSFRPRSISNLRYLRITTLVIT